MVMTVSASTAPGGSAENEDFYLVSASWSVVLDGVTRYPDDGCIHDVPWYSAHLGSALGHELTKGDEKDLRGVLAHGIQSVSELHQGTCDVRNPLSPAATVAMARLIDDQVQWLVLGDCAVAWRKSGQDARVESDDRLAKLANPPKPVPVGGIRRYPTEYIEAVRNKPGGFWVASSDPAAAEQALTGEVSLEGLESMALLTDGLTRLVERYEFSWGRILDIGLTQGIPRLIASVREAEQSDPRFGQRAKRHDDATGVLWDYFPLDRTDRMDRTP